MTDNKVPPSTMRVSATLENLSVIRSFVEETATSLKVDPDIIYEIVFAVNELTTNIIVHGYQGKNGVIEVGVVQEADNLLVHIVDQAPAFDPTTIPTPDLSLPLALRPKGGLGIFLTNQYVDEMIYSAPSQGGNHITLVKKCIP